MHPDDIRELLAAAIPNAEIEVRDLTGGGDHFEVTVVSEIFAGRGRVDQHQLVYAPLRAALADRIHALALKTYTPEQWRQRPKSLRVIA